MKKLLLLAALTFIISLPEVVSAQTAPTAGRVRIVREGRPRNTANKTNAPVTVQRKAPAASVQRATGTTEAAPGRVRIMRVGKATTNGSQPQRVAASRPKAAVPVASARKTETTPAAAPERVRIIREGRPRKI